MVEDLSSHARRIVGAKELPGLRITSLSLHLAHYPEALVESHVLPWSAPSRRGTLFGPVVTASFKKSGISPLSCQDRKEFCLSQNKLRPYRGGSLGLSEVQDGEAIPEPILNGP